MNKYREAAQRLEMLEGDMKDVLREMYNVLRDTGDREILDTARSYWLAHIDGAMTGRGSMVSLKDTLEDLMDLADEEEEAEVHAG